MNIGEEQEIIELPVPVHPDEAPAGQPDRPAAPAPAKPPAEQPLQPERVPA